MIWGSSPHKFISFHHTYMANENLGVLMWHKTADGQQPISETYPLPVVASPGTATPTSDTSMLSRFIGWAMYHITPTTRTDGQAGPLQADALGNLLASLATRLAGEDISRGIMKTQQEFQPYAITTAGSYPASMGPCLLGSIVVQGWAAGTIKIYDNTSATGTPILDFDSTNAIASYPINCKFSIGCYIVTSANTKVTAFIGV